MADGLIEAYVSENEQSLFSVDVRVNGHEWVGDEPQSMGGKNLGPAPYDLLLASLGECTAMTVRWLADKKDWPLERIDVRLTHEKRDGQDVFTKAITICGDELSDEQRQKLYDAAKKCPIQRTLMSEVNIVSSMVKGK